ncbi:MAG: hypothetical protein NC321_16650 [Clostridium sp.]|nr:hypothetical protein [Clostridium sp.]
MVLGLQIFIYLLFFTACIKLLVLDNPVRGIFFYPKQIQQRVFEIGLTTREEAKRRKVIFFTVLCLGIVILPVVFIGCWSGISDFKTAFIRAVIFLEVMNWYDGIVIDEGWVRFSKFWVIKGLEDIPHVKGLKFVLAERIIMSAVYIPVAAGIAGLAVMLEKEWIL